MNNYANIFIKLTSHSEVTPFAGRKLIFQGKYCRTYLLENDEEALKSRFLCPKNINKDMSKNNKSNSTINSPLIRPLSGFSGAMYQTNLKLSPSKRNSSEITERVPKSRRKISCDTLSPESIRMDLFYKEDSNFADNLKKINRDNDTIKLLNSSVSPDIKHQNDRSNKTTSFRCFGRANSMIIRNNNIMPNLALNKSPNVSPQLLIKMPPKEIPFIMHKMNKKLLKSSLSILEREEVISNINHKLGVQNPVFPIHTKRKKKRAASFFLDKDFYYK
jgi:hypothetical protein